MPAGFDILEHNSTLRRHWLRRIAAAFVDAMIIFIPMRIVIFFVNAPDQDIVAGILSGVVWFIYSGVLEGTYGKTLGKWFFDLRVVSLTDKRRLHQTFTRSVPKFFWYIFLPFDVIFGLSMEGDPRQRWSDRVSKTTIVYSQPERFHNTKTTKARSPRDDAKPVRDAKS
ncbi:MAG: RDD family protein [Methanomassiliicoccales archaeon]|nr:RDD family protein [Methanomassiliicoccales archaeon]